MSNIPPARDLPNRITDRDQWVCWRHQDRDGKTTKVPINPHTGLFGSATDPDTLSDFSTAHETAVDGSVDGIGFVFTDEDPLVGIDLDDCRVPSTRSLTDEAASIITTLQSYTEVSPSGTGVHILVSGSLPGERNRWDWNECYETARFFTVTGDHVPDTPTRIESRTSELETVYDTHQEVSTASEPTDDERGSDSATETANSGEISTDTGNDLSDGELLERAQEAANSEKFARLWRGSTSGYESHSEADMALCSLFAFWTGGDRTQIDRLFRKSGLMRPKWDERHFADGSTYGEKTIERVLESTTEYYEPSTAEEYRGENTEDWSPIAPPFSDTPDESADPAPGGEDDSGTEVRPSDRSQELLTVINDLQAHVERLEKENQQLRTIIADHKESEETAVDQTTTDDSLLRRLWPW